MATYTHTTNKAKNGAKQQRESKHELGGIQNKGYWSAAQIY
jgi:hypothetical protein